MLIETYDFTKLQHVNYVKHTEADGTDIQVFQLHAHSSGFELISESKILITFRYRSSIMVIDLLKGSSKSISFSKLYCAEIKFFRFC